MDDRKPKQVTTNAGLTPGPIAPQSPQRGDRGPHAAPCRIADPCDGQDLTPACRCGIRHPGGSKVLLLKRPGRGMPKSNDM